MWYLSFFVWFSLLSVIISSFIYVAEHGFISLSFMAEEYPIVYMDHVFFIPSSPDGHSGSFHVLAIVNSAIVSLGVHVSFWIMVFSR